LNSASTGLATLVCYQTAVGRELAQANDAIKQMAERNRSSAEGKDNSDSMPLPEEEAEIPNSEGIETSLNSGATDGADISAVPNLTERTQ
jgi:hypothetical protein